MAALLPKLQIKRNFHLVRNLILVSIFLVSLSEIFGQDLTTCVNGSLTGDELFDARSPIVPGGHRTSGTWSSSPSTLSFSPNVNTPNASISGFVEGQTYTITWTSSPSGTPFEITVFASGVAPTNVSLSTPSNTDICGNIFPVTIQLDIAIADGSGNYSVVIDRNGLEISTINIAANSTSRHSFSINQIGTAIFSISRIFQGTCLVDPSDIPTLAPITFTVHPPPTVQAVNGTNVCGGSVNDFTLNGSQADVTYTLRRNNNGIISYGEFWTSTFDGQTHTFAPFANVGTYDVVASSTACPTEVPMTGSVTIWAPPADQTFSTPSPACLGSDLALGGSEAGVDYYLLLNGSRTGAVISGTDPITFGNLNQPGTYKVEAERGACTEVLSSSLVIQPNPVLFELTANKNSYCFGSSPTGVELSLSGSQSGIEYQLQRYNGTGYGDYKSPSNGTGNPISPAWTDVPAGQYRVVASTNAGCSATMTGRPVVVESTPPSATVAASNPNSKCEGAIVDFFVNISLTGSQPYSFDIENNAGEPVIHVTDLYQDTYSHRVDPSTNVLYTLTNLTDASSCDPVAGSGQAQFFVRPAPVFTFDASPNPVTTNAGIASTSVCAGSDVTLDVNVSNTSGPYIYTWSHSLGNTQSVSFTPNATRIYYATVRNEYGCETTRQIEVIVHPLPVVDFEPENGDYEICSNEGVIELSPVAPNTGGTFTGNGVAGNFLNPETAGIGRHPITYTFTNTTTGCENSITKEIDVNPAPTVEIRDLQPHYCADAGTVTIHGRPNRGVGVWSIVGYNPNPTWFSDNHDGSATFNVGNALTTGSERAFEMVYTYTDPDNGCQAQVSQITELHDDLSANINFRPWADIMCQTDPAFDIEAFFINSGNLINDGFFSGRGITNTSPGHAEFDPGVAGNGNHTIIFHYTDPVTLCTGSVSKSVQIGTDLDIVNLGPLYCPEDGAVDLYGDPPGGVLNLYRSGNLIPISHADSSSSVNPVSFNPSVLGPGDYEVEYVYTDAAGCLNTTRKPVTVAAVIDASFTTASGLTQFCESETYVELVPNQSAGVFTITGGTGVSGNVFNPSTVGPGDYTITHTLSTGACSAVSTLDVTVIPLPTIAIDAPKDNYCDNETDVFKLEASNQGIGGAVYTFTSTTNAIGRSPIYTLDAGLNRVYADTITAEEVFFDPAYVGQGTYDITYTFDNSANHGCVSSVTRTLTVNEAPGVNFGGPSDPIQFCEDGGDIVLNGSFAGGGFTGSGNFAGAGIDNGIADDGRAVFDPTLTPAGDHPVTYTYTDTNGCKSERTKIFEVQASPVVYNVTPKSTIPNAGHFCEGDAGVVIGVEFTQGSCNYHLIYNSDLANPRETVAGRADGGSVSFSVVNIPGSYTVLAESTASMNCTSLMNGVVEVKQNKVAASIDVQDVLCRGGNNGEILVTASGGSSPYQYFLNDDAGNFIASNSSGNFTGLIAGNYQIEVIDAIGCVLPNPVGVTVNEPVESLSIATTSSPVGCAGCTTGVDCEGTASVSSITGGTPFADLTAHPSGYIISWTDALGNGVPASADGLSISLVPAGDYTVTVTDANGCSVSEVVTIETVPDIVLSENLTAHVDVSCHGASTGQLSVTAAGGAPSAAYRFSLDQSNWFNPSSGGNERTFQNLAAGTYQVYVRDANYPRCIYQVGSDIVITQPEALAVSEVLPAHADVDCNGSATGVFEVSATGGSGNYEFSVNGGAWDAVVNYTGMVAGTYYVRVRDALVPSCVSPSLEINISQPASLKIDDYIATPVSCHSGSDGSIEVAASGGAGNYVYSITAGPEIRPDQPSNLFENLPAGTYTYTVTVTDDNGCTVSQADININQPPALTLNEVVAQHEDVLCRGDNSGSFTVAAGGGSGNYEFSMDGGTTWFSNGTTSYQFTGLSAGTYTANVRDGKGCIQSVSVSITQPASSFNLSTHVTHPITCVGGNDGEITAEGTGGTASSGVNYVLWKHVAGTWINQATATEPTGDAHSFPNLNAGDYRVTATDANGCADEVFITMAEPASKAVVSIVEIIDVSVPGGNNGAIEIAVADGTEPYSSIDWSGVNMGGVDISTSLTDDVYRQENLPAGTYSVQVTDATGCVSVLDNIVVNEPGSVLGLNINAVNPGPCYGAVNGSISLSATGGVTPYASITLRNSVGTVFAKATAGNSYATYTGLSAGTYIAEVEDGAGISYTESITLTTPDALSLTFNKNKDATCNGATDGSVTFSVTGGTPIAGATYNYVIIPQTGASVSGTLTPGVNETVSNLPANSYELQITDALGCFVTQDFMIEEPAPISFDYTAKDLSCFENGNGEISVENVQGGWGNAYRYDWEKYDAVSGNWVLVSDNGPATLSNLSIGEYRVTVTGLLNNCSKRSGSIFIRQPEQLTLNVSNKIDVTSCFGDNNGEVWLKIEGGTPDYIISYGGITSPNLSGVDTYKAQNLAAGNYNFEVEDINGCTDNVLVNIIQPEELTVDNVSYNIDCESANSGSISMEISGGQPNAGGEYEYVISLVNSGSELGTVVTSATSSLTHNFTNLPAGDYSLRIWDANSTDPTTCTYSENISLKHIQIDDLVQDATCKGINSGSITLTVTGGSGDYTYQWTKTEDAAFSRTTKDIATLSAGTYNVEITDNVRGCTLNRTYLVSNAHTLVINGAEKDVTCHGAGDGAVLNVSVSDPSSAALSYSWSGGILTPPVNTSDISGVGQGTYTATVTDGNGCAATRSFVVNEPAPITYDLSTDIENCAPYSRSVTLDNLTGGTGTAADYRFSWSGPGTTTTTQNLTGLTTGGTYQVTVRDANDCSSVQSIVVPSRISVNETVSHLDCYGDNNGSIVLHVTGGSGSYSYSWSTADGSGLVPADKDQTGLTAGIYTVTVTDVAEAAAGSNCSVTKNIVITQPTQIVVTGDRTHIICAGNNDGSITLDVVGGTGNYTYNWSSANGSGLVQGQKNQIGLTGGNYSVTVTDDNGCTVSRSFVINEPAPLTFDLDVSPTNCANENSIEIINQSGGSGTYAYTWAGPGVPAGFIGTVLSDLPGGDYTIIMTDVGVGQQCQLTQTVSLVKPLITSYTVQPETCPGSNNGRITLTVTNGKAPYAFAWTTANGSGLSATEQNQSGLSAGNYQVTVTDDRGCDQVLDIEVTIANTLSVAGSIGHVRCFNGNSGAIDITVAGGSGNYLFNWSGPGAFSSNNEDISNLSAGSYTVEVIDADLEASGPSCRVTKTFMVNQPVSAIAVSDVNITHVLCRGAATGAIDITVAGGTAPYGFNWTGPGNLVDPTNEDIANLVAGNYNVVITDANNCMLNYAITITQPDEALTASLVEVIDVTVFGGSTGAIEIDVDGGTGSYTITWYDASNTVVPGSTNQNRVEGLIAGTYRVEITDENGCFVEIRDIIVRQPDDLLDLVITQTNVGPCNGADNGTIGVNLIGGTLPYQSITLLDGGGQVGQTLGKNNALFTNLPAGDYEVVGLDANNIEIRRDVIILQPPVLNLNAVITQHVDCYQAATGIITVRVNGGWPRSSDNLYRVSLTGGPTGTNAVRNPQAGEDVVFNNLPKGNYTIRVVDDSNGDGVFNINNDCYKEQALTITQPEAGLTLSTVAGSEELCEGGLPMLQIITANWPVASQNLEVTLSDGHTYIVNDSPFQFQPVDVPGTGITQYTITSVEIAGCNKGFAAGTAAVEVHPLPTARIFGNQEICIGETTGLGIELTGRAPWSVEISDGTNTWNEIYNQPFNAFDVSPVADATYEILSVTDGHCTNTGTGLANVTVHELPEVSLAGNADVCAGASTNLTFTFNAGTAPWTVTILENGVQRVIGPVSNPLYNLPVSPAVTTNYQLVSVKDVNGCEQPATGLVKVTVRPWPEMPVPINGPDVICQGATAVYSVDAVPSATGYVWTLPVGATILSGDGTRQIEVAFANNAQSGNLSVYATNGCGNGPVRTLQLNIDKLPSTIGLITGPVELCQGSTGVLYRVDPVADASGYNWSVPAGFSIVDGQGTATIEVDLDPNMDSSIGNITVTPENNCGASVNTSTLTVRISALPEANAGGDQNLCGTSATLDADPLTNSNWSGSWEVVSGSATIVSPSLPNSQVNNLSRGNVVLRWTVSNNTTLCGVSDEVTLRNNQLSVAASADENLVCDGETEIYGTPVPGYPNTNGLWTFVSGSGTFVSANSPTTIVTDLAPGTNRLRWTLTQNGCTSYAETVVINNQPDQAVIDGEAVIDLCTDATTVTANVPIQGTGVWTVEQGAATIDNVNSAVINVTHLAKGENILRWTISKGSCSTFDEVTLRNNQLVVNAGDDETICEAVYELAATQPPAGVTGTWEALGAAAGVVQFGNGHSATSTVSNLVNGENRLQWTLNKNGCESVDEVIITSNRPTQAITGSTQTVCGTVTTLTGNTPTYGLGRWSVVEGSGNFTAINDPQTDVTGLALGKNVFRWTIRQGGCSSSSDVVVNNVQVVAYAGKDTVVCDRILMLNATPVPPGYSGYWSVIPGMGGITFTNGGPDNPSALVRLDYGQNGLLWNVVHNESGCTTSDEVYILVNAPDPTELDAGGDQLLDGGDFANLNASPLTRGTGQWSLVSGGGTIDNPDNPSTQVTGLRRGPNVFRWTVTIGNCSDFDEVIITNGDVIDANAGPNQTVCTYETVLQANDPDVAIGVWSLVSGSGKFVNRFDPRTRVYDLGTEGDNVFRWTISYGAGTSSSSDEVIIVNNTPDEANAGLDDVICNDEYLLKGNTPAPGMGTTSWALISGSGTIADPLAQETMVTGLSQGNNVMVYTIKKGLPGRECYSVDSVIITNGLATQAIAGNDQTVCEDSVVLRPNIPNHGTGEWRVVEGSAEFDGNWAKKLAPGLNKLAWVISTELCDSRDTVEIMNNSPSVAFAGNDQPICRTFTQLSGSVPVYGTGEWTPISGSGTIVDPTDPYSAVTGLGKGRNRFRWTINNNGCKSSDEVEIINNVVEAIAGDLQINCADTAVLAANNPSPGIGTWGVLGGSGSAMFDDPSNPYTVVRGLDQGENILTWTINNQECTTVSQVSVINNLPTKADAGSNRARCVNNVVLSANNPAVGTGSWSIRNGSGTFVDATDPTTRVDNLNFGANIFRWTIENNGCKSSDDVQIDFNTIEARAGDDDEICSDEYTLEANSASPGTGTWTVVGGTSQAVFENINDPNTRVMNLRKGRNVLRWSINNLGCETFDEIVITNNSASTAYAGNTQTICEDQTVMDATPPEIGTGHWEVLSGSGTIADVNDPHTAVTGLFKGDNVFRWVVQNGICSSSDEVRVVNNRPSVPYAGADIEVCSPTLELRASTPEYGQGQWSILEGGANISNPADPRTPVTNLIPGTNRFRWTLTQGQCTLSDDITIVNNTTTIANAGPDVTDCKNWAALDANTPIFGTGEWSLVSGQGSFVNPLDETTNVENLGFGENVLMWTISNGKCFSTDLVTIFNKVPDQANAGKDQTFCENYTMLNANDPTSGAGRWSVVSGAGEFENPHLFNTKVVNVGFGDNVYKWTVGYGECTTEDVVNIRSNKSYPYAGEDVVVYEPEVKLNANNAGDLDAAWSVTGGSGEFEDNRFFNTRVTGLSQGINTFRWTIDVDGCVAYDDVVVDYRPVPDADFITDVDNGCYPLTVKFTNYSKDAFTFHWNFGDGNSSGDRNPVHTFESAGEFNVVLTTPGPDGKDGTYQKTIAVYDHPQAAFDVTPNLVYVPGKKVRFTSLSVDAVDYLWNFGDGNSSTEQNPMHNYLNEGVYDVSLWVANAHGCTDSMLMADAVTAKLAGFIKFPNAFRPRPDGAGQTPADLTDETNTVFKPVYRDVDTYQLQIFNRWGQLIFESGEVDLGWDGLYKGQLAPQAVYVWKVSGRFIDGTAFRDTGSVLLVR